MSSSHHPSHLDEVVDTWGVDLLLIKRDRAAAALDRLEAALARKRADAYLLDTYRDRLTGALQRAAGRDRLAGEVARAHRTGAPLVLAFLDVVGLKTFNDTLGHATGDLVLAAVGTALVTGLRTTDVVVRYGGDEFVCGLPDSSLADAGGRLSGVQQRLAQAGPGIGVSVGLAQLEIGEALDELIGRADSDLYERRLRVLRT